MKRGESSGRWLGAVLGLGAVAALIAGAWPATAQVPGKSRRACAREYALNRAAVIDSGSNRRDFIASCRRTAAGTPTTIGVTVAPPPLDPPDQGYKLGYMFAPAYLSSPQVLGPALRGAGLIGPPQTPYRPYSPD